MPIDWDAILPPEELTDLDYATRRLPDRMYLSRSFILRFDTSRDFGQPARYATRVFDLDVPEDAGQEWEWSEMEIYRSPAGRVQVRAMVAREAGTVRQLKIERVTPTKLEGLLTMDRDRAQAFIDFIRALQYVDAEAGAEGVRLDERLLRDLFQDPTAVSSLYSRDPEQFRSLIRDDNTAEDLVALARRREVVAEFRSWLEDATLYDAASEAAGGPEKAWQNLFEENPWILGVGLGGQLLTAWDNAKLEHVVAGYSLEGSGKRIDALLKTQGPISSMVLAEIKHHRTALLSSEYRPGCWSPSRELAGAIVQTQQTAYRASMELSERIVDQAPDGSDLGSTTFNIRPRTYLIVGCLTELLGETGGVHLEKYRSFELHRRNLHEPVVLTFDEFLARAEWQVKRLEQAQPEA